MFRDAKAVVVGASGRGTGRKAREVAAAGGRFGAEGVADRAVREGAAFVGGDADGVGGSEGLAGVIERAVGVGGAGAGADAATILEAKAKAVGAEAGSGLAGRDDPEAGTDDGT